MLKGAASSIYSKTYGINEKSSLLNIEYFSLFDGGLPHDPMHDIFEGLAPLEIKKLLSYYISANTFTLSEFNERLINFDYGYTETDKPVPILSTTLKSDKALRSSASEMIVLVHILPFLIGDKILENEDHWACFLQLRKIIDIVLSPIVTENDCSSLKLAIKDHHTKFVQLYGCSSYIPKMHFLVHYPEQILNMGPMVHSWTMRYEAKLSFFKQASQIGNFKNISFTLANRHQHWMCYEMASRKLLDAPLECGPNRLSSIGIVKEETDDIQKSLHELIVGLSPETSIFHPRWVKKDGILYKPDNAYLIVGIDGIDPIFGHLDDILIAANHLMIFKVSLCKIVYFDDHYHAYVITTTSNQKLYTELLDYNVYHAHKLYNGTYLTLKYNICMT